MTHLAIVLLINLDVTLTTDAICDTNTLISNISNVILKICITKLISTKCRQNTENIILGAPIMTEKVQIGAANLP